MAFTISMTTLLIKSLSFSWRPVMRRNTGLPSRYPKIVCQPWCFFLWYIEEDNALTNAVKTQTLFYITIPFLFCVSHPFLFFSQQALVQAWLTSTSNVSKLLAESVQQKQNVRFWQSESHILQYLFFMISYWLKSLISFSLHLVVVYLWDAVLVWLCWVMANQQCCASGLKLCSISPLIFLC